MNDLIKKYVELFEPEDIRRDITKSCMAFGIECGRGWYDMLENMMKEIIAVPHEGFYFTQIKEKFGTLRAYNGGCTDEIDNIINKYEELSATICDVCGKEGKANDDGWIAVRCEEHRGKR